MATPASCWYRRANSDMTTVLPPPVGRTPITLGWPCAQAASTPAIRRDWYSLSTLTPLVVDGNDFWCIVASVPQVRNHNSRGTLMNDYSRGYFSVQFPLDADKEQ